MKKLKIVGMLILCMLFVFSESYAQNLFVVSSEDGFIYKYTPAGVRSTFASGLVSPQGLAFDRMGNLFLASGEDGRITKFASDGVSSFFAQGLKGPSGLAVNSQNDVLVAHWYGGIDIFQSNGVQGARVSEISWPVGITFNTIGNLFAVSHFEGKVYEYAPDWIQSTYASGLRNPAGLAFDSKSNLFVGELFEGRVIKITPEGEHSIFASGINTPFGLAFDSMDNLFVVSQVDNSVYKFTTNGIRSTFASGLRVPSFLAFEPIPFPVIIIQPKSQTIAIGSTVYLTVRATNSPVSYQWHFGTNVIDGATNSTFTLTNVHGDQSGMYTVMVMNQNGTVTSDPALLSVLPGIGINMIPRITVVGETGLIYQLEFINSVGPTNVWQILSSITVTNNPQYFYDDSAIGQPARFYRLQQSP